MRYKTAPGPVELIDTGTLEAAHTALPLVPEDVEDCCARVVERTAVPDRDHAREWITFMEALGLADETPRGYRRVRADVDPEAMGEPFSANVFGVAELLGALETGESQTVADAFDALRPTVPEWERDRHDDWEAVWSDRVERLLAWSVALGLAVREDGRYRKRRATGPTG
jgi:hypothetical protein